MAITSDKGKQALKGSSKLNTLPGFSEPKVPVGNPYAGSQPPMASDSSFSIGKPQKETKSKRVNLVLQPSLYEKAQEVAKANGISFNEMITQMLRQITNEDTE